jgi:hypothetical protein
LKNLNELTKAQVVFYRIKSAMIRLTLPYQLLYHASAAEALSTVQGDIEELSVAAEGEYRYG